jgi:hypothetical protein
MRGMLLCATDVVRVAMSLARLPRWNLAISCDTAYAAMGTNLRGQKRQQAWKEISKSAVQSASCGIPHLATVLRVDTLRKKLRWFKDSKTAR